MSVDLRGRNAAESLRRAVAGVDPDALLPGLERLHRRRSAQRVVAVCAAVAVIMVGTWVFFGTDEHQKTQPVQPTPHEVRNGMIVGTSSTANGASQGSIKASTGRLPGKELRDVNALSFSADGAQLAFSSRSAIFVRDLGTGLDRRLGSCLRCDLSWSPAGDALAVTVSGRIQIWSTTTGERRNVDTGGTPARQAAWSPDGQSLAFLSNARDSEYNWIIDTKIHVLPVDGGEATVIYASPRDQVAEHPQWSADGTEIAFLELAVSPGKMRKVPIVLRAARTDGSGVRDVAAVGRCLCLGFSPDFVWAPDGNRFAVASLQKNRLATFTVARDGTDRQPLPPLFAPLAWQGVLR
jgi:dipeptidyl aminopeptidase/acylaminoacyl peptidase